LSRGRVAAMAGLGVVVKVVTEVKL
jgi:hypothetical protein